MRPLPIMARFKYNVFYFVLLVGISCTLALSNRVHLAHKCETSHPYSAEKLPVIMLHGLSDVKETWNGIFQSVDHMTGRRVCIYDARNHGDSGWNDVFNVDALSEDLGNFMEDMKIEKASLVGHSLGGLTVMKFALKNPKKVESIFVEDMAPKIISRRAYEYLKKTYPILLNSLSAIPPDADEETAKKAVMDYLTKVTKSSMDNLFRVFPLRRKDGTWQWKANFKVFIKELEDEGSFLGKMEGQYDGRAFFIYGTASHVKVNESEDDIRKHFPNVEFFGVKDAGHWVHNDNSTIYLSKLLHFLNEVPKNECSKITSTKDACFNVS